MRPVVIDEASQLRLYYSARKLPNFFGFSVSLGLESIFRLLLLVKLR